MSKPTDKVLYEKVKKEIYKQYKKPSAYRSGALVKKYKSEFKKKHPNKQPYTGLKNKNSGLSRWYREHWTNQRGQIGYQKRGDIYRPTIRISKKTPTTYLELSEKQIKKAMAVKKKTGRVKKF